MAIKLKLELQWTEIKRVITVPKGLSLLDLHNVIQAMLGFEHDHLWNFRCKDGREWNTGCTPFGDPLDMDMDGMLDPDEYAIEEVLCERGAKVLYSYDYGDGWEVIVTRMADSKDDEILCLESRGTNAMEDVGGEGGPALVFADGALQVRVSNLVPGRAYGCKYSDSLLAPESEWQIHWFDPSEYEIGPDGESILPFPAGTAPARFYRLISE